MTEKYLFPQNVIFIPIFCQALRTLGISFPGMSQAAILDLSTQLRGLPQEYLLSFPSSQGGLCRKVDYTLNTDGVRRFVCTAFSIIHACIERDKFHLSTTKPCLSTDLCVIA